MWPPRPVLSDGTGSPPSLVLELVPPKLLVPPPAAFPLPRYPLLKAASDGASGVSVSLAQAARRAVAARARTRRDVRIMGPPCGFLRQIAARPKAKAVPDRESPSHRHPRPADGRKVCALLSLPSWRRGEALQPVELLGHAARVPLQADGAIRLPRGLVRLARLALAPLRLAQRPHLA